MTPMVPQELAPLLPQPILIPYDIHGDIYLLAQDYSIVLPVSRRLLTITAGFITDGCSIPQMCWSLIGTPFDVAYMAPALCHDAGYAAQPDGMARSDWDAELHNLMDMNYPAQAVTSDEFHAILSMFGGSAWDAHTPMVERARKYVSVI